MFTLCDFLARNVRCVAFRNTRSRYIAFTETLSKSLSTVGSAEGAKNKENNGEGSDRKDKEDNVTKRVLDFFNSCDYASLKNLTGLRPVLFRKFDPLDVVQYGTKDCRFKEIDEFLQQTGFQKSDLQQLNRLILKQNKIQKVMINKLKPEFKVNLEDLKKIEQVTVLDVYQRHFSWSVQLVGSRKVISAGYTKLFDDNFKFNFDHIRHYEEITGVLDDVPESPIYLVYTYGKKTKTKKKVTQFDHHQNIMEAVLITILKTRSTVFDYLDDESDYKTSTTEQPMLQRRDSWSCNSVYLFDQRTLGEFYDVLIQGELVHCGQYIQKWQHRFDGPLDGLYLQNEVLDVAVKQEQVAKCILMSDIFCRRLSKFMKSFPNS